MQDKFNEQGYNPTGPKAGAGFLDREEAIHGGESGAENFVLIPFTQMTPEDIAFVDAEYAQARETHEWMQSIEAGSGWERMMKMRIWRNNRLDTLGERLIAWESLSPNMRTFLQDLMSIVREVNNA